MKINPEKILSIINSRDDKAISGRQLLSALKLPPGARRMLHRQMRELERQGLLRRGRGGRYVLVESRSLQEGTLSLNRRGDGLIRLPDDETVRIPNRFLCGAGECDKVRFATLRRDRMNRLNGKVIEIVERSGKLIVGMYQRGRNEDFVLPVDASFSQPIPIAPVRDKNLKSSDLVVVKPVSVPGRTSEVRGELVTRLGASDDPVAEIKGVAYRFALPVDFPPEALAELDAIKDEIRSEDLAARKDLRELPFVTIDGETARDFDDAVTVIDDGETARLFVAIADVSHYVAPGGALDSSALERGTSVYFTGYCIPMLPEKLSNDICSLRPDVDRMVMVAEMLFNRKGQRQRSRFYPAVIRSRARMTYNDVQEYLDQPGTGDSSTESIHLGQLRPMLQLSKALTRLRMERGSLDFEIPEAEVLLNSAGRPASVSPVVRLASHRIVEEFMLAANEAVAEFLAECNREFPYRIHEPPEPTDFTALNQYLKLHSLNKLTTDHDLHSDLQHLVDSIDGESSKKIVSRMLLRSMKQARYSCDNEGHYGLAAEKYCHFTSPIRRYPDLVVHRVLKQTLSNEKPTFGKKELARVADQASRSERTAVDAERDVMSMYLCRCMEDTVGMIFSGHVSGVHTIGLFEHLCMLLLFLLTHQFEPVSKRYLPVMN